MLTNLNFFFTKMVYFSNLISNWHEEIALGKETVEEELNCFPAEG
jgi:hypothetical protein